MISELIPDSPIPLIKEYTLNYNRTLIFRDPTIISGIFLS